MLKLGCDWKRPCGIQPNSLLHLACLVPNKALDEADAAERATQHDIDRVVYRGKEYRDPEEWQRQVSEDRELRLRQYGPLIEDLIRHFIKRGGTEEVARCEDRRTMQGEMCLMHYFAKFGLQECAKLVLQVRNINQSHCKCIPVCNCSLFVFTSGSLQSFSQYHYE